MLGTNPDSPKGRVLSTAATSLQPLFPFIYLRRGLKWLRLALNSSASCLSCSSAEILQACYSRFRGPTPLRTFRVTGGVVVWGALIVCSSEAEWRDGAAPGPPRADANLQLNREHPTSSPAAQFGQRAGLGRGAWLRRRGGVAPASEGAELTLRALSEAGPRARARPLPGAEENVAQVQKWNVGGVRER